MKLWVEIMKKVFTAFTIVFYAWPINSFAENQPSNKAAVAVEPGLYYLPNEGPAGVRLVKGRDLVLDRPARWGISAKPEVEINFQTSKGLAKIKAGSILPEVVIDGLSGAKPGAAAFCTLKRNSTWGVRNEMWGPLWSHIVASLSDGRICLLDQDEDGLADSAFLIGTGTEADRTLHTIKPVALNVATLREADDGRRVQIQLLHGRSPKFRIQILDGGKPLVFESVRHGSIVESRDQELPQNAVYPIYFTILGAKFKIIDYSFDDKVAKIEYNSEKETVVEVPTTVDVHYTFGF